MSQERALQSVWGTALDVSASQEGLSCQAAVRTVVLSGRHVSRANTNANVIRIELDSHADTCCVGSNVLVLREHTRVVNVHGYDPTAPSRQCKIVDCVVKFTSRDDNQAYLLAINQAILVPELEHCLLCPMQCRLNGVVIDECPKFLSCNPINSSHSILLNDSDDIAQPLLIPLRLHGVISYFDCERPSLEEVEEERYPCYVLTASSPDWDPTDPSFNSQEDGMVDYRGRAVGEVGRSGRDHGATTGPGAPLACDEGSDETPHWKLSEVSAQYDAADVLDVDNFAQALEATVQVSLVRSALGTSVTDSGVEDMRCMSTTSRKRRGEIDYITLANRWQIPL